MSRKNIYKIIELSLLILRLNKYYFMVFIILLSFIFLFAENLESTQSVVPFVGIFTNGSISTALVSTTLQFTFFSGIALFILNIFPNIILFILYSKGKTRIIDYLHNKNKILVNFMGYYSLVPFVLEEHIKRHSSIFWKLVILFMHGLANFTLIYFLFRWEFLGLRSLPRLVELISNNILYLFIFNTVLFVLISTLFLGFCFICMLSIRSIIYQERNGKI